MFVKKASSVWYSGIRKENGYQTLCLARKRVEKYPPRGCWPTAIPGQLKLVGAIHEKFLPTWELFHSLPVF